MLSYVQDLVLTIHFGSTSTFVDMCNGWSLPGIKVV